jgi:hypothetical protein
MTRRIGILIALSFLITTTCSVQAQQTAPPPAGDVPRALAKTRSFDDNAPSIYYRLDFAIRELDREKLVDTRNYTLLVQSGVAESIVAGSEVPYPSSTYSSTASAPVKNISYRSVGVSINAGMIETDDSPRLDLLVEVSDAVPPAKDSDSPVFRKVQLHCRALLPLGKPTTVGVVEDPASRHRFQVDVTATKLK